jgi:hypothetical protein
MAAPICPSTCFIGVLAGIEEGMPASTFSSLSEHRAGLWLCSGSKIMDRTRDVAFPQALSGSPHNDRASLTVSGASPQKHRQ